MGKRGIEPPLFTTWEQVYSLPLHSQSLPLSRSPFLVEMASQLIFKVKTPQNSDFLSTTLACGLPEQENLVKERGLWIL